MNNSEQEKNVPFYQVYRPLIKSIGLEAAVLIAVLDAKQKYMYMFGKQDGAGYFYYEHPQIEKDIHLSEYRQKSAMKVLTDLKLLSISAEKKGTPPKKFYKVDSIRYEQYVMELDEKIRNEKQPRRKRK